MAKLTTQGRKAMPKAEFGLPAQKAYPMPDKSHARAAKSGASRAESVGNISPAQKATVDAKADKVLGGGRGNGPGGEVRHPQSHAEFEKLGR